MTEVLEAPTRPAFANFVGGEWRPSRPATHLREARPLAAVRDDRRVSGLGRGGRRRAPSRPRRRPSRTGRGRPAAQRAAILMGAADAIERRVEQIAQDMTLEMGKPLREARMEAARGAAILRYFAGEAWRPKGELFEQSATGSSVYTVRRPVGVVGLITPWNFPAAIPAWKTAPALIYGNTVVMKLAQEAPLTGLHLAACLDEAGIPAGVFNVVIGRGSEVGTPLVRHPNVAAISFTGSVAVGSQVRDEATGARQARPARARRPQPADRDGRRRPRPRRRGRLCRRVLVGRPEVHRHPADLRPGRRLRRLPRQAARADRAAAPSATRPTRPPRSGRS